MNVLITGGTGALSRPRAVNPRHRSSRADQLARGQRAQHNRPFVVMEKEF